MRIVIDLQGGQTVSRFRGIGRYSLSLAMAIARNAGSHDIWLVLNDIFYESVMSIRNAFEGLIPQEKIRVFQTLSPVSEIDNSNFWRIKTSEILREEFIKKLNPDVVYVTSLFEGYNDNAIVSIGSNGAQLCTAVTLYDLIPLLNQEDYLINNSLRNFYFRKIESIRNANLLLAISESSRNEAIKFLNIDPSIVINVSAAASNIFKPISLTKKRIQDLKDNFGISRHMIMYAPGGFDKRKNFELLINSYSKMEKSLRLEHQLVIVGDVDSEKRLYLQKLAENANLNKDDLILTGYIKDQELVEFYNFAKLFIFPSKHEGFGLPPLEAMACGTAVIGSNNTSISEVINNPDALFNPFSSRDITEKLSHALTNHSFREELALHGLNQSKKFTWDHSAKLAIQGLELISQNNKFKIFSASGKNTIPSIIESIVKNNKSHLDLSSGDLIKAAQCISFNIGNDSKRQILLDISVIVHGDAKSGIQRVVRALLLQLYEISPKDCAPKAIFFDGIQYKYANSFISTLIPSTQNGTSDDVVEFFSDDIYLALDLNAHLTNAVHDLHLKLQSRGVQLYFIVYDLLLLQHPEWWIEGTSEIFDAWIRSITKVATGILCISRSVANELFDWISFHNPSRIYPLKIGWFHLGADISKSSPSRGLPSNSDFVIGTLRSRISFLMVGTIEPRKGHSQCLAAFEYLWSKSVDINLVIVGKQGWLVDKIIKKIIEHPELNSRLFWLEGISDEYLEIIYSASSCLIAASEGEGFGLPLIEAAINDVPIIARDIPVFREVAGDHALFFSGLKANDLAEVIQKWIFLNKKKTVPLSRGIEYISWHQSANNLLNFIFKNSWYKIWSDSRSFVIYANDSRFGTKVGHIVSDCMVSSGQTGYLIFGPYIELDSGSYLVEIFGFYDCSENNFHLADFDVCTNAGEIVFSDGEIFAEQSGISNFNCSYSFYLADNFKDIEFRIRVSDQAMLGIRAIKLSKVESSIISEHQLSHKVSKFENPDMVSDLSMNILRNGFLSQKDSNLCNKLALSFIVKDEALIVLDMLKSICNAVGFVSFIDTGSSDESIVVITNFLTEKSIPFAFKQNIYSDFSFAKARNDSVAMIPKNFDWVLVLDCDEVMLDSDISCLSDIINSYSNNFDCFEFPRYNWKDVAAGRKTIDYPDFQQRLFKNNGIINYSGKVHERLSNYSSKGYVGDLVDCVPHIHHTKLLFQFRYKVIKNRNILYNQLCRNSDLN